MDGFDREYLINRTLRRLGLGRVSVPITKDSANDAIDEVLLTYSRYFPLILQREFTLLAGMTSYEVPVWGRGIVRVDLKPPDAAILGVNSYYDTDPFYLQAHTYVYPNIPGSLSFREAQYQHSGMAEKMLSADFNWEFLPPSRSSTGKATLLFSPGYVETTDAVYTYVASHVEPDTVKESDQDLIMLGTLAKFKEVLGEVHSKYPNGIPAPDGPIVLSGDRLLAESQVEWERFEAKLAERRTPQEMFPW